MGVTAAVVSVVAASGTYAKGKRDERKAEKKQKKEVAALEEQAAEVRADDQAETDRSKLLRRNRQSRISRASFGRNDTILTGALGVTNEPTTQRKTLLGS